MSESTIRKLNYSIISTLICCVLILIYRCLYKKSKKIQVEDCVLAALLIIISSLRYGVGSDYFRYMESAARWAKLFSSDIKRLFTSEILERYSNEIGYKLLSVLSYKISDSPYTVFWIVSIIIYIPIVIYCRKYTKDSFYALAIYLLFGYWGISLNVLGQSIAMVLILFAKNAINRKKYITGVILVICAETFHATAIVAAVLIILPSFAVFKRFLRPTKMNLAKIIIIGIILRTMIGVSVSLISRIRLFSRYTRYLGTEVSELVARNYTMIGTFIETFLVISILYMAITRIEKKQVKNQELSNLVSIIMIGIPFSIVGISRANWLWLSNRFAEYFFIFLIALIPEIMAADNEKVTRRGIIAVNHKKLSFWLVLIAWHAIFSVVMFNNNKFIIDTYLFK